MTDALKTVFRSHSLTWTATSFTVFFQCDSSFLECHPPLPFKIPGPVGGGSVSRPDWKGVKEEKRGGFARKNGQN
jgi:hypothetical protein